MTLVHILIFIAFTLLVRWLCPPHWRGWLVLLGSLLAVFWLQPSSPIRNLDFWLPVFTITMTVFTWAIVHHATEVDHRPWFPGMVLISSTILIAGLLRYLPGMCCLGPSRPPPWFQVLAALAIILALFWLLYRFSSRSSWISTSAIFLLLVLFVILKLPFLANKASSSLRTIQGQSTALASYTDLSWLGFSYLAFRLIHTLRDFQTKKPLVASVEEFSIYALFYPAITAGPIDRLPRFLSDLHATSQTEAIPGKFYASKSLEVEDSLQGGTRIFYGVFKKFVLADSLALISLNYVNAPQTTSTSWMWVLLYAYALRLYFDFSGYTDIAIGLGRLAGIRLPENFDRPYFKTNLTAFWNSWHITLAQWFRAYFFNPFTRYLRTNYRNAPTWTIILVGQLSTMILIGLWHGITWSFLAWGTWHGIGLFIHNRWIDWQRSRTNLIETPPHWLKISTFLGGLVTFQFVTLGWVWFAMPDLKVAVDVFQRLFGR